MKGVLSQLFHFWDSGWYSKKVHQMQFIWHLDQADKMHISGQLKQGSHVEDIVTIPHFFACGSYRPQRPLLWEPRITFIHHILVRCSICSCLHVLWKTHDDDIWGLFCGICLVLYCWFLNFMLQWILYCSPEMGLRKIEKAWKKAGGLGASGGPWWGRGACATPLGRGSGRCTLWSWKDFFILC